MTGLDMCREAAAHGRADEGHQANIAEPMAALESHKAQAKRVAEAALAAQKEAIVNADIEDQAVLR